MKVFGKVQQRGAHNITSIICNAALVTLLHSTHTRGVGLGFCLIDAKEAKMATAPNPHVIGMT